jgi:peptide-methionine (R)-S-oxide reductase
MFGLRKIDFSKSSCNTGFYHCACCNAPLFHASDKFDSGTGFPSFWKAHSNGVKIKHLDNYGRKRIQLQCENCGSHLGHLFSDGRTPTGQRYCIMGNAIKKTDI